MLTYDGMTTVSFLFIFDGRIKSIAQRQILGEKVVRGSPISKKLQNNAPQCTIHKALLPSNSN